ncbi:hypothetical protein ACFBZI_11215 [Moraxella sp. ZJ142]|uniref:hypothetical protein n=1 Tax=Moraxella marmotae TaxID=3344520 RepID=UPI0035D451E0
MLGINKKTDQAVKEDMSDKHKAQADATNKAKGDMPKASDLKSPVKEPAPKGLAALMKKPIGLIGAAVGVVTVIVLIVIFTLISSNKDAEVAKQRQLAQQQEQEQLQQQQLMENKKIPDFYQGTMALDSLPPDHWAKTQDPIGGMIDAAVKQAIEGSQDYNQAAGGLQITPEVLYPLTSVEYAALTQEVANSTRMALQDSMKTETLPDTGKTLILLKTTPQVVLDGGPEYQVIADAAAYQAALDDAARVAAANLNQAIMAQRLRIPPPAKEEPAPVDTGISQAQRNEFTRLLNIQKDQNAELQRENERLAEELRQNKEQMKKVYQDLEDNPAAQSKLKMKALNDANYKVQAVQGDLVFLQDKKGNNYTVRVGQALPDSTYIIAAADSATGLVFIDDSKK